MAKKKKDDARVDDRPDQLAVFIQEAKKNYGKGAIDYATKYNHGHLGRITTGSLGLDIGLGGGLPVGRVSMFYGQEETSKTTCFLRAAGRAQRMCSNCWTPAFPIWTPDYTEKKPKCACGNYRRTMIAWLDVEGVWDDLWSEKFMRVDDSLLLTQPESGEQASDIADGLLRSGAVDLIVIDSVAMMTPIEEIEKSASESTVGAQARLLGNYFRKLTMGLNALMTRDGRKPSVWLTNQIRYKVGVMFGCFHADTPVSFADGTTPSIREVVEGKLEGPVLSWDGESIVERRIVGWHENGVLDDGQDWLTFRTSGTGGRRGAMGFTCTRDHVLVNGNGEEVSAKDVRVGDDLMSWSEEVLTSDEYDIACGSLLGDGQITAAGNFSLANQEQPEYLRWKIDHFSSVGFSRVESAGRVCFRTPCSYEFRKLRTQFYDIDGTREGSNYRSVPLDFIKDCSPRVLAIWYCDDGSMDRDNRCSISVKRLTDEHAHAVADAMSARVPGVIYRESQRALVFQGDAFRTFMGLIADHIPECMAYKVPEGLRDRAAAVPARQVGVTRRVTERCKVVSIRVSRKKSRDRRKYDLTIEGNSFYLVGGDSRGVVVHNSPETKPGGQAQRFATSTTTRFTSSGKTVDKDTKQCTARKYKFKVEKNKTSTVKLEEGEYRLILADTEVKKTGQIMDEPYALKLGVAMGLVEKKGTRVGYNGEEYAGRSLLERYWMLNQGEYEDYKAKLIGLLQEQGGPFVRKAAEAMNEQTA